MTEKIFWLLAVLVPGYNKDLSFSKDYKVVATPHFAVQKRWKNPDF